jgi:hypothetical protein
MVEQFIVVHPWLPALLWAVLYASDYQLTLVGARLRKAQDIYLIEGSYELTPEYQDDVDKDRKLSSTYVTWLLTGIIIMLVPWASGFPDGMAVYYGLLVGAFLLPELVVHVRHLENIIFYRGLCGPEPGVSGSLTMSRKCVYERSATQLFVMSGLVLVLSALTMSPILLGGVVGVARCGWSHRQLAKHLQTNPEMVKSNDASN